MACWGGASQQTPGPRPLCPPAVPCPCCRAAQRCRWARRGAAGCGRCGPPSQTPARRPAPRGAPPTPTSRPSAAWRPGSAPGGSALGCPRCPRRPPPTSPLPRGPAGRGGGHGGAGALSLCAPWWTCCARRPAPTPPSPAAGTCPGPLCPTWSGPGPLTQGAPGAPLPDLARPGAPLCEGPQALHLRLALTPPSPKAAGSLMPPQYQTSP